MQDSPMLIELPPLEKVAKGKSKMTRLLKIRVEQSRKLERRSYEAILCLRSAETIKLTLCTKIWKLHSGHDLQDHSIRALSVLSSVLLVSFFK